MKRLLYLTAIMAFFAAFTFGYSCETLLACGTDSSGCLGEMGHSQAQAAEEKETATDPVCAMDVKKDPNKSIQHEGWTYYFCSEYCMEKFQGDTVKYACPCAAMGHAGCNCSHCSGSGSSCECAEKHKKGGCEHKNKHEHEHKGGEEHRH